jgi:non-heme chloroperoxidase
MDFVESTDGAKIAVYDFQPECEKTVFLVHGWPLSHKMYEYQIERLLCCGDRVVAMDLRGYGASDVTACGYDYNQMAADLYSVVCALHLKAFTLVGFSMGGAIALRYMRRYRGAGVKHLILLAAAAPCWPQSPCCPYGLKREAVDQLIAQARTDRAQLAYDFSHKQLFACPQSNAAKRWFESIALSASGVATVRSAIALRDEDGRRDLAAVCVPTTIFHGDKDIVVPNSLAMVQHKVIRGSRLVRLPNSGHGIVYDELEAFNRLFLASVKSGK